MQGQEREIIIVSFTTASPSFASLMADFLFQPQRLNVAVTRPRSKLILVGSHHMLDGENLNPDQAEIFAMLRDLLDNCLHLTLPDGILI
jgi:DNA replication ATP-dependent helicase Dna2